MPEWRFGRARAVEIRFAFFSRAVTHKLLLPIAKSLARIRQNPWQLFASAFFVFRRKVCVT